MKSLHDIADLLDDEIKAREDLISQMVGRLYPNILLVEIYTLQSAVGLLRDKAGIRTSG